jgi:hypothetical protein
MSAVTGRRLKSVAASAALTATSLIMCLLLIRTTGITYDEPSSLAFSWAYWNDGPPNGVIEYPPVISYLRGAALMAAGAGPPPIPSQLDRASLDPHAYGQFFLFYNRVPPERLLFWGRAVGLVLLGLLLVAVRLWGGLFALAFAALDPNLLAHASLATSDLPLTAFFAISLSLWAWTRGSGPSWAAVAAGAVAGLALGSKATAALLPIIFVLSEVWSWAIARHVDRKGLMAVLSAVAACLIVVILAYLPTGGLKEMFLYRAAQLGDPAPSYLFGRIWPRGHPFYFPAMLAIKTTLPLLMLGIWGLLDRRFWPKGEHSRRIALTAAALLLLAAMSVRFQYGVRHVLPLYPLLALGAGTAAAELWRRRGAWRLAAGAALAFHAASSLASLPHPIAYVNEAFGGPQNAWHIVGDSNVDWGQALPDLARFIDQNPGGLILSYFGSDCPARLSLDRQDAFSAPGRCPGSHLLPVKIEREWLAVSVTQFQGFLQYRTAPPDWSWLRARTPVTVAGHAILIYDITRDADAHERLAAMYAAMENREAAARETTRARIIASTRQ